MGKPLTIFDKIWTRHAITERDDGDTLLYIDRLLTQENSYHAFDKLRREGRTVRNPDQVFSFALTTDEGATFDREVYLDASEIAPMVTWGTSPEDVVSVSRK